ncbi:MAG: hypothetical protein LBH96_04160 [Candidatus Peribacteria bacterium]|jgi:hypothetical protein|nr:hypothetical protein [Candidatus Peribacteria bacterium]
MELKDIYIELQPQKNSKKLLADIAQDLEKLFLREKIEAKVQKNHHMTIAYFQKITTEELADVIATFHQKKKEYQGIQTLNKELTFDQSIHQINIWESNITKKVHIVLTPHNPENVYGNIIQSNNISPHINLAEIQCNLETANALRDKVKRLIKPHIQEN